MLESRNIDLSGLEVRSGSKTFRWTGRYEGALAEAETVEVHLNVLSERAPVVPEKFADSRFVFLANTHPTLQRELLAQITSPRLSVCDTMNLWIEIERDSLVETLTRVTGVILNDGEARQLTGRTNLIEAAEFVLDLGPKFVMVKKGEHGALLVSADGPAAIPAYPSKLVRDPTGAGDSFAGGVLGYLASQDELNGPALKRAMVHGTVAASFAIEDFSLGRVQKLPREEIDDRVDEMVRMLRFD
jgi:sugar/nucleoside kinase (ribokinase family)